MCINKQNATKLLLLQVLLQMHNAVSQAVIAQDINI